MIFDEPGSDMEKTKEYERKAHEAHPPEYAEATGEVVDENGERWNPQLHLQMHATVLRQLDEWDLAKEVFDELQETYNMHEHAVIHAFGNITTGLMFEMMNEPEDADPEAIKSKYRKQHENELKDLLDPDSDLHEKWVEPFKQGAPPKHKSIQKEQS